MSEIIVSGQLPVLALRGLVVFPRQTVHFDVAREKSIKALEAATEKDQLIFLVPQKRIIDDDPGADQRYPMGCVAKVKQVLKNGGETQRVLVTGLYRARIAEMNQNEPYMLARVEMAQELHRLLQTEGGAELAQEPALVGIVKAHKLTQTVGDEAGVRGCHELEL